MGESKVKCKNCARYVHVNEDNERTVGEPNWCFYISDSPCEDLERDCKAFTPLRNADRNRAMTDEELAKFICKTQYREGDICPPTHKCAVDKSCEKCWLEWLKQEVSE